MQQILIITSFCLILTGLGSQALAQEATSTSSWAHESEAAVVTVTGNTESESYSAKQKTTYKFAANALILTGRYLNTQTNGAESARAWDAGLRYERLLTEWWSIYLGYGAESDIFAGYVQRDNTDLGGKYFMTKTDDINWFAELGYRYTKELPVNADPTYTNYGRLYSEYAQKLNDTVSFKFWVEYLPNFDNEKAYLLNAEPSLSVMLNSIFSLKTAYLVKYQNQPTGTATEYVDSTFTTSLVAKF